MIDISFHLNGKKVRPDQIGNELEKAVFKSLETQIKNKLSKVTDPITGEKPKVECHGKDLSNLSFKISGSENSIKEIKELLGAE